MPSEWKPIETAPKDQTIILSDGQLVDFGGWVSDIDQGAEYEGQLRMAGWWLFETDFEPTIWQPRPEPPKEDA